MAATSTHPIMSASAFWANKTDSVKLTNSTSPILTELPPKRTATSTKMKKGLVLKPMNNGAVQPPSAATNGKLSWADTEDDDNLPALPGLRKDRAIATLEAAVSQKDARIGDLEAYGGTTALRIEQLEASGTEKDALLSSLDAVVENHLARTSELEYVVKEKNARIFDLEEENKLQSSHVQRLVAQVDEKNCRIAILEKELDTKAAIIRELKTTSDALLPASVSKAEIPKFKAELELAPIDTCEQSEKLEQSGPESDFEVNQIPVLCEIEGASTPVNSSVTSPVIDASDKAKIANGPTFTNTEFPVFVTEETLKAVPPAPAPKKLTFPINWAKYSQKAVQTAMSHAEKKLQLKQHGKDDMSPPTGLAAKMKRDPSAGAPGFNPSLDIRQLPLAKRMAYGNGPEVAIKMGNVKLGSLPKFMLMQCSGKAHKHFSAHPDATSFVLPANSMAIEAAKLHMKWMDEMTYQGRVYSVTLNAGAKHDLKNLQICRAARILGLNNTYIGHFTKQLCDRIRNNDATVELMDLICTLSIPENDPVFDCLANNLATRRARKAAEFDVDAVAKLEAKHPALAKKLATISACLTGRAKQGRSRGSSTRASSSDSRYLVFN